MRPAAIENYPQARAREKHRPAGLSTLGPDRGRETCKPAQPTWTSRGRLSAGRTAASLPALPVRGYVVQSEAP